MVSNLGRLLRKIRIDNDEILKDMADRFGVTASYLSAVENGKRAFPGSWETIIHDSYCLNEHQKKELRSAIIESVESINMDVADSNYANKEVAFTFARRITDLPAGKLEEIRKILGGDD